MRRGAGQPWAGFRSLDFHKGFRSKVYTFQNAPGDEGGLWGQLGFMASDSLGELVLSVLLVKWGNERGEGSEPTTFQQNHVEIKVSL